MAVLPSMIDAYASALERSTEMLGGQFAADLERLADRLRQSIAKFRT